MVDVNFSNKIFFSDEAHFTLGGYVNKRNWGSKNPQVIEEKAIISKKQPLFYMLFGPKGWLAEIAPNMYQKVVKNYLKTINACNTSRGSHLNDLVFHT